MIHQFFNGQLNATMHYKLFKKILMCCVITSISVYLSIHIILFDFPFIWQDEIKTFAKIILMGTIFAITISTIILMADVIDSLNKKRKLKPVRIIAFKEVVIILILLITIISACQAQSPTTGVVKDASTGLTASYKNIKPTKVLLVMNDEIIHHNDIPLGEKFLLVNNGIEGLTVKNGHVSVGCALTIKNKAGLVLLQSDDLFNGNDIFKKENANFLKCTVSTGKPMKWEEKYDVTVIFWDKYGTGKIENKVTIKCIDIP